MKVFSTGQVANLLGVHRDRVITAPRKKGAPTPSMKIGNRNAYTKNDVMDLYRWFVGKDHPVTKPVFDAEETPACMQSNS